MVVADKVSSVSDSPEYVNISSDTFSMCALGKLPSPCIL